MSYTDTLGASEFRRIIAPLEEVTTRLGEKGSPSEADVYYDRLRWANPETLSRAVTLLLDTHEYKRFPSIAEIKSALNEVANQGGRATLEDLAERNPCPKCHDGYLEAEELTAGLERSAAIPCDCVMGQRRVRQWKKVGLRHRDLGTVLRVRLANRAEYEEIYGTAGTVRPGPAEEEVPF